MSNTISNLTPITPWSDYVSPMSSNSAGDAAGDASSSGGFGGVLKNALQQVNELRSTADAQIGNLLQGGGADMNSVMVSVEKADVSFQLMMQVRNKVVSAYQDIEKMQF